MSERMDVNWKPVAVRLSQLTPWERNPKRISKNHASRLLDLWQSLGQFQTVAIGPAGEVYDGHQRLSVLKTAYGPAHEILALQSSRPLTEREREELTIAAHTGTTGQWNWDALSGWDAGDLQAWGFDAELLRDWNAGAAALATMLEAEQPAPADDPGAQIDRAAELREKWGVEPGQIWRLGEHRLICGDCTDRAVVDRVMGEEKAQAVIIDPEWDAMPDAMTGYASTLVFCDGATLGAVVERYGSPAWVFAWDCVTSWYTPNRPLRRMKLCAWYGDVTTYQFDGWHYGDAGDVRNVHNTRGTYVFRPDPRGKHLSDVFQQQITQTHSDGLHNHSKPADWVTLLIANCTKGTVFDPFLGSGTTIIAAQRLGRRCFGIDIDPGCCAVAIQRWVDMTGGECDLVNNGRQ